MWYFDCTWYFLAVLVGQALLMLISLLPQLITLSPYQNLRVCLDGIVWFESMS